MSRGTRRRIVLAAGVLALLALAFGQWRADQARANGTLLGIAPASVRRIEITLGHEPTEHYLRQDGRWWRTDGTPRPADDGRLDELAEVAAAPVLGWRAAGDFQMVKIGLAPPQARLVLDGRTLEFGERVATGEQRYVRSGERIARVAERYLPRPANGRALQARPTPP